jgi:hypothetical protein
LASRSHANAPRSERAHRIAKAAATEMSRHVGTWCRATATPITADTEIYQLRVTLAFAMLSLTFSVSEPMRTDRQRGRAFDCARK